jgi:hypothetical protein
MKVWISLDKIDGSQSRLRGPVYVDEIDLHGLLFYLSKSDVAGVTFTRADILSKLDQLKG